MKDVPTRQIVRPDGMIELPIVLDFNFGEYDKVVGYAVVDPDLLPSSPNYCFSLAYVKHDDGRTEVTGLSVTDDNSYFDYLREDPDRKFHLNLEFTPLEDQ